MNELAPLHTAYEQKGLWMATMSNKMERKIAYLKNLNMLLIFGKTLATKVPV